MGPQGPRRVDPHLAGAVVWGGGINTSSPVKGRQVARGHHFTTTGLGVVFA